MKNLLLGIMCSATLLPPLSYADDSISKQDAVKLFTRIKSTCRTYIKNGEAFWRGDYKSPSDAAGLVLLNKEIQQATSKVNSEVAAGKVGWQICLDAVFNDQKSSSYIN